MSVSDWENEAFGHLARFCPHPVSRHKRAISPKSNDRFGFKFEYPERAMSQSDSETTQRSDQKTTRKRPENGQNKQEDVIIELLKVNPYISRKEISGRLGLHDSSVRRRLASLQEKGAINPNRSLDAPSPFLIGKTRLSGILPASVRIMLLATPRRSPLRLRLGEKHAANLPKV